MKLIVLFSFSLMFLHNLSSTQFEIGDTCYINNKKVEIIVIFDKEGATNYLETRVNRPIARKFADKVLARKGDTMPVVLNTPADVVDDLTEKDWPIYLIKIVELNHYELCCSHELSLRESSYDYQSGYCDII